MSEKMNIPASRPLQRSLSKGSDRRAALSAPSPTAGEGGGPPARRGRPPRPGGERVSYSLRLARDELEELEAAAARADQPVRTYIREAALARAREERGEPAPPSVPLDEAIEAATEALRELAGRRS